MKGFLLVVAIIAIVVTEAVIINKNALIIIDVQNCFVDGGTLPVPNGTLIIPVINNIRNLYDSYFSLVVLSQDWHCYDHVSFASQYKGYYKAYDHVPLTYNSANPPDLCANSTTHIPPKYAVECSEGDVSHQISQNLWPDHCVQYSLDAQFVPTMVIKSTDIVVQKGNKPNIDSYSALYDNGGFSNTTLPNLLRSNGITNAFVVGLAFNYCVFYTSVDCKTRMGLNTYVVEDACRGIPDATLPAARDNMIKTGINVIQSSELGTILASMAGISSTASSSSTGKNAGFVNAHINPLVISILMFATIAL